MLYSYSAYHRVLHWKNSEQPPTCPQIGSSAVKKTDELTGFEVLISFLFTEICICDQYLVSCLFSYFLLLKMRSCPPVEISVSGMTPAYLQQLITNNWLPGDCVSFGGGRVNGEVIMHTQAQVMSRWCTSTAVILNSDRSTVMPLIFLNCIFFPYSCDALIVLD